MLSSQDLQFFIALSAAPSLAAAARALDVTPSLTQRLRQLEDRVGVRLIDRTSRRLHLTQEGQLLAERAFSLVADLEQLADDLATRQKRVAGHLRVAAPFGFGRRYVAPAMAALRLLHPDVDLTLNLFDELRRAARILSTSSSTWACWPIQA